MSSAGLNLSPKPDTLDVDGVEAGRLVLGLLTVCPGFGVSHALHFVSSFSLTTQQIEHVQESFGGLNLSPKPWEVVVVGCVGDGTTFKEVSSVDLPRTSTSRTLPLVFSSSAGLTGVDDSLTGSLGVAGLTGNGELKLKLGGFEVPVE